MHHKEFMVGATLVLSAATILHALRIYNGWTVEVAGVSIPMWVSWAVVIFVGFLAWNGLKYSKR